MIRIVTGIVLIVVSLANLGKALNRLLWGDSENGPRRREGPQAFIKSGGYAINEQD